MCPHRGHDHEMVATFQLQTTNDNVECINSNNQHVICPIYFITEQDQNDESNHMSPDILLVTK